MAFTKSEFLHLLSILISDRHHPHNATALERRRRLTVPFAISGMITASAGLALAFMFCYRKYEVAPVVDKPLESRRPEIGDYSRRNRWLKVWLVVLGSLFLICYMGSETTHFQFAPLFAHSSRVHFSDKTSAIVLSAFAAAYTVGRGVGLGLTLAQVRPQQILCMTFVLMAAADLVLLTWADTSGLAMWGGNILLGLGFSAVYPAIYAYLEQHLTISNIIGTFFIFSSGLMTAVYPPFIGKLIGPQPQYLIYFSTAGTVGSFLAFVAIFVTVRYLKCATVSPDTDSHEEDLVAAEDSDFDTSLDFSCDIEKSGVYERYGTCGQARVNGVARGDTNNVTAAVVVQKDVIFVDIVIGNN